MQESFKYKKGFAIVAGLAAAITVGIGIGIGTIGTSLHLQINLNGDHDHGHKHVGCLRRDNVGCPRHDNVGCPRHGRAHDEQNGSSSSSTTSNACPRCGWFVPNIQQWPVWNGLHHTVAGRKVLRSRVWSEVVLVVRAGTKAPFFITCLPPNDHLDCIQLPNDWSLLDASVHGNVDASDRNPAPGIGPRAQTVGP
jgi:hypothetical protein